MRKFAFVLAILAFAACGQPAQETISKIDSQLGLPIPLDSNKQQPDINNADSAGTGKADPIPQDGTDKEVTVSEGIVYYTLPYCGGARPSEEIVAEKKKSRLLTNSTLKLKNKAGTEYLVVTNSKGIFRSGIPAGQYEVYLTKETNKDVYNVSPETCDKCLTRVMANVIIQKDVQASFVIHFPCGPNDKLRP